MSIKRLSIYVLLGLILLISMVFSAGVGAMYLSPAEILDTLLGQAADQRFEAVLWHIRLPRVALGVLVGAALSMGGVAMQGLFRNPLADPSIVGISAGATLFAAIAIVFGLANLVGLWGETMLSLFAFLGAGLMAFLIYQTAGVGGSRATNTILLAGIALQAMAFACTGLLTYLSDDQQLRDLTFWSLGSLGAATWPKVGLLCGTVLLSGGMLYRITVYLNVFSMGEQEAHLMGVNTKKLKWQSLLLTTFIVATATAFCGTIGFVGLAVPHVLRMTIGADHRVLLPASALAGGSLLTLADAFARTVVSPAELPIGILTALIGTPVFLYVLFRQNRKMQKSLAL